MHFIIYKFLLLFFFQINGGNFEINTTQRDSNNISLVLSFHFFPLIFMQKVSDYRAVGLSNGRTLHTKGWAGGVCKQLEPPHQTKIQVLLSSIGSWFFFFCQLFLLFLRSIREYFTQLMTSTLSMKRYIFRSMLWRLQTFKYGGIFIVPQRLWHKASVFDVSSIRRTNPI